MLHILREAANKALSQLFSVDCYRRSSRLLESCSKHYVVVHHHMNVASTQVSELAKQSKGGACYL